MIEKHGLIDAMTSPTLADLSVKLEEDNMASARKIDRIPIDN